MRAVDDAQRECAGKDLEIVAADKEVRRKRAYVLAPEETRPPPVPEAERAADQCVTIAALA
jgi:hypothetical protein